MRRFGPKSAEHPSVGKPCPLCLLPFKVGDYTTLLEIGPADEEEASRKRAGRVYTAEAREVHWECARCHVQQLVVGIVAQKEETCESPS